MNKKGVNRQLLDKITILSGIILYLLSRSIFSTLDSSYFILSH